MNAGSFFGVADHMPEQLDHYQALQEGDDDTIRGWVVRCKEKSWTGTFKWRSLFLTPSSVLLRADRPSDAEAFLKAMRRRSVFTPAREIPIGALIGLYVEHGVIGFRYINAKGKHARTRIKPERAHNARQVVEALAAQRSWTLRKVRAKAYRLLLGRGIGVLLVLLAMWLLLGDAERIAKGLPLTLSGQHKGMQLLLWKVAEQLGTTGIWIAGTVVAVSIVVLTFRQWLRRGEALVWP